MLQGLLQLLALPLEPGSDSGGAVLPVVGALCDVLEHLLAQQRGERSADEEQEEVGGLPCSPLAPPARRSFAAHALEVLLAQLQPYPSAFQLDGGEAAAAAAADAGLDGMHSPLGVPDVLRREAGARAGLQLAPWRCANASSVLRLRTCAAAAPCCCLLQRRWSTAWGSS